ncbi:MAG: hypothetical protein E7505_03150 [Ruminococcus sp.]|nr:hypothetical protein [Ruminococcus sp.]
MLNDEKLFIETTDEEEDETEVFEESAETAFALIEASSFLIFFIIPVLLIVVYPQLIDVLSGFAEKITLCGIKEDALLCLKELKNVFV